MARETKKRQISESRARELEISEDADFQRLDWKLQRVGWGIMGALVIAGLLGFFGRGPVSKRVAGDAGDPLRVEYNRFLRRHADEQITLLIAPSALSANGEARVSIDSTLLREISIRRMTPEPEKEEAHRTGILATFRFDTTAGTNVGRVRIDYQADGYWSLNGAVAVGEHAPLRIHCVVFP
ncbi:MAG TPA: hypothetical protein VJ672_00990 [Gemmatimonadaceae bacterium]|nr:hypothetical protein [Gemmatimonadaceae bacterium]